MSLKRQRGFSLLEVLVSLAVVVVGTLGLLGLQALAIHNTQAGAYRSQAASQAASLVAAIKANPAYWGAPAAHISVQASQVTGGPAVPAANGCSYDQASTAPPPCCVYRAGDSTVCSAAQIAYSDMLSAGMAIANSLPLGQLDIRCDVAAQPAVCTLAIRWTEKNIALHNPVAAASAPLAAGTEMRNQYQTQVSAL